MKKITAEFLANTKIRVTPEQSKQVQELALSLGYRWLADTGDAKHLYSAFLFFTNTKITWGESDDFAKSPNREITYADLFPEAEEPITPEALEKEPGWQKVEVDTIDTHVASEFKNDRVRVLFLTDGGVSVYCHFKAKGTDTMPKLRLLTELINGKS